jgi:hypothetical protein
MSKEIKQGNSIFEKDGQVWYAFIEDEINPQMLSAGGYDFLSSKHIIAIPITGDWACPQMIPISGINSIYYFEDMIKEAAMKNKVKAEDFVVPFIGGIMGVEMKKWYPRLVKLNKKYAFEYRDEMVEYFREILVNKQ